MKSSARDSLSQSSGGDSSSSFWDFEGLGMRKKKGEDTRERDDDSISTLKLKERVPADGEEVDAWQRCND